MAAKFLFFLFLFFSSLVQAQVPQALAAAIRNLEADPQFKYAVISFYVEDEKGRVVFDKNSQSGLAPASCQKVITSATGFDLLGPGYRFETAYNIKANKDTAFLEITASGDPTLGSWRWPFTKMQSVYKNISAGLEKLKLPVTVTVMPGKFSYQPVPDGWVWQDIGNYFGAGAWHFNWHENQYDLGLRSGNDEGSPVTIVDFQPPAAKIPLTSFISTGKKGSGDNAYIYSAPYGTSAFAMGTIPPDRDRFVISGAMPNPSLVFINGLSEYLEKKGIEVQLATNPSIVAGQANTGTILSPRFDSMNYWFMKKSINLYGEAFVKAIAIYNGEIGSTEKGIALIKAHWQKKGIDADAINILDGSGLSPANRITTQALVKILQYAKQQKWFGSFETALPVMNGITMKDGYIGGVRSYAGYCKSAKGGLYVFSFIVNNFNGSPGTVREKMWKVLDILK